MSEKYYVVSASELEQLKSHAKLYGNFPPGEKLRREFKSNLDKAESACRARPVKQVELGWPEGTVYKIEESV